MVMGMRNEIQIGIRKLERLYSFENLRRDLEQEFLNSDLDFVLGPNDHFESRLLGNGLYLHSEVCVCVCVCVCVYVCACVCARVYVWEISFTSHET